MTKLQKIPRIDLDPLTKDYSFIEKLPIGISK